MLRALLVLVAWCVLTLPVSAVGFPVALLTGNADLLYRWGLGIAVLGLRLGGVRGEAVFEEPLPTGKPLLFLVNHASNLDPPLVAQALGIRVSILVKRELLRIPLLGWGMRLADFVAVARSGSVEDAKHSLEQAAQVLRSGRSLVVFVEGTRSPDGRLLPFKRGPFFLAESSGVQVVPVTIAGTSRLLRKGSIRLRPGRVRITVHAPLDPADYPDRAQLSAAVRAAIASALPSGG